MLPPPPGFASPTASPAHAHAERQLVHVLWLTSGLGCDGDSVAMTAATNPSVEDLLVGALPGAPRIVLYNQMLAFESGEEFVSVFARAAAGKLDPFVMVLEGSVPNEELSGEGHWAGFGVDPDSKQPITTNAWIDRLVPRAAAVLALGTCAAYGGIPAMRGNPTGAMGLRDYLGAGWTTRRGAPIVNLPGCPVQPDSITQVLLHLAQYACGAEQLIELDEQARPRWLFSRTVQEGCGRAGFAEQGEFAKSPADARGCLVKLGCSGPVAKCNVPTRGWINGIGGCPNVGGICIACTMPGFPDAFMPMMDASRVAKLGAAGRRFAYAPLLKRLRARAIDKHFDVEPDWRAPGQELTTGYKARW
ncbi:MAG: NADH-quinone oxidoreductase subunit B family protein [Solirubrobacteraceae bacterium]